jgi:hypothetical protein
VRRLAAAICAALALSGCAGFPIGHDTFIVAGIAAYHIQHAGKATAISSRSLGASLGCDLILVGVQESFCAHIPINGDVAIIDRGKGADQHLTLRSLRKETTP